MSEKIKKLMQTFAYSQGAAEEALQFAAEVLDEVGEFTRYRDAANELYALIFRKALGE